MRANKVKVMTKDVLKWFKIIVLFRVETRKSKVTPHKPNMPRREIINIKNQLSTYTMKLIPINFLRIMPHTILRSYVLVHDTRMLDKMSTTREAKITLLSNTKLN